MRYLKTRCERIWTDFVAWIEWQDAKCWAKEYHPAWVEIVKRTKNEEVREYYKKMILAAYRGDGNG